VSACVVSFDNAFRRRQGFHFAEAERMVNATAPDEESVFMEEAD
jgi:hypothetical protein